MIFFGGIRAKLPDSVVLIPLYKIKCGWEQCRHSQTTQILSLYPIVSALRWRDKKCLLKTQRRRGTSPVSHSYRWQWKPTFLPPHEVFLRHNSSSPAWCVIYSRAEAPLATKHRAVELTRQLVELVVVLKRSAFGSPTFDGGSGCSRSVNHPSLTPFHVCGWNVGQAAQLPDRFLSCCRGDELDAMSWSSSP